MKYTILISGESVYSGNSESEFLDKLEEFADSYYNTGTPDPGDIQTLIEED
jgi:hypothetical protein